MTTTVTSTGITFPDATTQTTAYTGSGGVIVAVTGVSPVASSGGTSPAISLSANYGDTQNPYASKAANYVLAAPNGSSGAPTFRPLVANDVPTLNQNTSGTAAGLSSTLVVASGGTGITAIPAKSILVANTADTYTTVTPGAGQSVRVNAGNTAWEAFTPGVGTVTGVTGTTPINSSGGATPAISLASGYGDTQNPYATKTSNYFLAAPAGSSGAPSFRAIVASDIPTLNQNTAGNAATATTASNATNLGGYSAASYPRLAASNTFTTVQVVAMPTESQGMQVSYGSYLSAVGPRAVQCGFTGQGLYSPSSGTISLSAASGGTWGLSGQNVEWSGSGNAYKIGGGSWAASSDARLKTNPTPLTGALNKIVLLNPVSYGWKYATNEPTVGFIAQEVEQIIPTAVGRVSPTAEQKPFVSDDVYSLGWQNDIFAYLVGAIKELKAEVDALKAAK